MLSLVFILVLAFIYALSHGLGNLTSASSVSGAGFWDGTTGEIGRFAIAIYAGLWAFDGWVSRSLPLPAFDAVLTRLRVLLMRDRIKPTSVICLFCHPTGPCS